MSNYVSSKPGQISKSLKGNSMGLSSLAVDALNASSLKLETLSIAGLFEDGIFTNITVEDSTLINCVIGAANSPNAGYFTTIVAYNDVTFYSQTPGNNFNWDASTGTLTLSTTGGNTSLIVEGCAKLGNIKICNNNIYAVNNNGDINLMANGLGTLYLGNQVYNYATVGNFTSILTNGGATFNVLNDISLLSSKGSAIISTFDDQTMSTINGDITLQTENPSNISIISINTTAGNTIVNTASYNELKSGDVISITNSGIDGYYTVGSLISNTSFMLTTTIPMSGIVTHGTLLKSLSNNIYLNTSNYIKIPERTKLIFGATCNSISSSTLGNLVGVTSQNMYITSCGDVYFTLPNTKKIQIPETTHLVFGTSGNNYINYTTGSLNFIGDNTITFSSPLVQFNSTNTHFYDPILTIGDYTTYDNTKDRGLEYYYTNSAGNLKLGWFGYKQSTDKFTFIPDAINNNEVISGIPGKFEIGTIDTDSITINGDITMNCGQIYNVHQLSGCSGVLNLYGSTSVNISTGNRIALNSGNDIYIPNNIPLTIGTNGSKIYENTIGSLVLTGSTNIKFYTQTNGSLIVPIGTKISFDGSSIGNQQIVSDTSGNLYIKSNNNLYLTTTVGNIIIPSNTNIQLGNSTETIYGNTSGITIKTTNTLGTLNLISNSSANIISSFGNINIDTYNGDINLLTSNGNTRLLQNTSLIFNISGTSDSIKLDTSNNLVISGNGITNGNLNIQNMNIINLSAGNSVNIPNNKYLYFGNESYIISNTSGLNLTNSNTNGNKNITITSNTIVNSSGTLNIINNNTNITSNSFIINGLNTASSTLINTQNVKLMDPILTLANYTVNDNKDRGIEFNYTDTNGNTHLAWFGWKNETGNFTFYSDAINTNEVISGTRGQFELSDTIVLGDITFENSGQTLDLNCGKILNVNTITGCGNIVNIIGPDTVNLSAGNIYLDATNKVLLPYSTPLVFGNTANSLTSDSNGNLTITSQNGNGYLIINSNVQINGTTENVYSTITNYQDPIISIGGVNGPIINDLKDRGIEVKWSTATGSSIGNSTKTGFFGYKNNIGRFVYIKDGINNNEIFSGAYGDVQFGNGYFTNIDIQGGTIANISSILGGNINIISSSNSINLSSANIYFPQTTQLDFGTSNSISSSSGNLTISSNNNINIESQSGGISLITNTSGNSYVDFSQNTNINIGTSTIINDTLGNLDIINSTGNIVLSTDNVNIPVNSYLNFGPYTSQTGGALNNIFSDGAQLILNGYQGISLNSTLVSISGDINIIGKLSASTLDFDLNKYILPLGTRQILDITLITNYIGTYTTGNIQITTDTITNFTIGDSIILKNTNSSPVLENEYIVSDIIDTTTFLISSSSLLISQGTVGSVISDLMTYQGKDVGIQVNYWTTTGNIGLTSGSLGYHNAFFGWKNDLAEWVFYNNATIANNIVLGTLGNIKINELYTNKIAGFILDGSVSGGNNAIMGTNFQISGGSINNTPIGQSTAQSGRFTNLSNTVSASLNNVTFSSNINYTFERYTLSSGGIQTRNPSINYVVSLFSVTGPSYTSSSGTMPSSSANVPDGAFKMLICSSMGTNSQHTIYFGPNKLITPNPISGGVSPTKLIFKRQGQSVQMLFDATANSSQGSWIILNSGCYVA